MPRPALPLGRWLPWVLAAVGALLIARGLVSGEREMVLAGAVGLAGVLVAFPVGSRVAQRGEPRDD